MTPIICGFSGTLKSSLIQRLFPDRLWIQSPQKYLSRINREYLCWSEMQNPVTNLLARLESLQYIKDQDKVIERSYLDFVYFATHYWKINGLESVRKNKKKRRYDNIVKTQLANIEGIL